MIYNNCEYIRDLYEDFRMFELDWSYGMSNNKSSNKELVIISPF